MAPPAKRVDGHLCARCRKEFKPGDRVVTVMIVEKTGRNPSPGSPPWEKGAFIHPEFEMAHLVCADPGLDGLLLQ